MDDREQRGLVIAATKPIRQRGVNWYVPSATGNGTYKVEPEPDRTIGDWLCECPDFQLRASLQARSRRDLHGPARNRHGHR